MGPAPTRKKKKQGHDRPTGTKIKIHGKNSGKEKPVKEAHILTQILVVDKSLSVCMHIYMYIYAFMQIYLVALSLSQEK